MYKNARPPRSVSPELAQKGERHKEPPKRALTTKEWKAKRKLENLRIAEKREARRREGF
jgi:hypothetical protein